jgi:hypothetical protein
MIVDVINQSASGQNPGSVGSIPLSQKGAVNGVATLGADGLVPAAQLPNEALIACTNAQRLAGSGPVDGIRAGQRVKVTDQGNRIEQYNGGGTGAETNWTIVAPSYEVRVSNTTGASLTYNGVSVANGASLFSVGKWAVAGEVVPVCDDAEEIYGTARIGDLVIPMQALAGVSIPDLGQSRSVIHLVF